MPKRALQDKAVSIEYVSLSELQRAPRNPKRHDEAAIESSISRFGYVQPIVIDERTGRIVAGHGRLDALQAMKAAGKEPPPRIEVDGDEWKVPVLRGVGFKNQHEAEAFLLADNQLTTMGGWDNDALADMLAELQAAEVPVIGWGESEIGELLAAHGPGNELHGDLDDAPEPPAKSFVHTGDLWTLGDHRLLCGDCTKAEDVARVMGGERADLCLTDPPYGIGEDYASHNDTQDNLSNLVKRFLPISRGNSTVTLLTPGNSNQRHYPPPDWTLAWFVPAGTGRSPWGFSCWQPVLAYGADPYLASGNGCRPDAFSKTESAENALGHPCPKPVGVWSWVMERGSLDGALVLDPFCGSGTTIIAAEKTRRRCRAIEIEPRYVEVSLRRWEQATGKAATLDGKPSTQVEAERKCAA